MPTVEFVMEERRVEVHQSNDTIEVTVREIQKQMIVAREVEVLCTNKVSDPGVLRGAREG